MANEKFDGMLKLLKNSSFKFDNVITDDLICLYCKNVLINAHQAPCGCKFCRDCVEKLIELANEICPGSTEECKENIFSKNTNISVDYRTNNIIYKLKVKCPNDNCYYECDFKNMSSHYETCKSSISDSITNGLESEALCKDNELIILVNKLLDSVNHLKDQEESNKKEIENLKENIFKNNSISVNSVVEIAQNEIQKAKKLEANNHVNDVTNLKIGDDYHSTIIVSLKRELRKRESEIAAVNQEMNSIKTTYSDEFKQRMEVYFNDKLSSFIKDMKTIYENEMILTRNGFSNMNVSHQVTEVNLLNENYKMLGNETDNKENIEHEVKDRKIVDPYIWCVEESPLKMNKGEILHSADFFSQDKCYLMRLSLSLNRDSEQSPSEWNIDLCLIDEGCEVGSGFPMNRVVTVDILDQTNNASLLASSRTCSVNKEEKISLVKFAYSDIFPEVELNQDDLIAIRCAV